jgi:hypothetical protein
MPAVPRLRAVAWAAAEAVAVVALTGTEPRQFHTLQPTKAAGQDLAEAGVHAVLISGFGLRISVGVCQPGRNELRQIERHLRNLR